MATGLKREESAGSVKMGSSIRCCCFLCDPCHLCAYPLSPTRPRCIHPQDLAYVLPPLRRLPGSSGGGGMGEAATSSPLSLLLFQITPMNALLSELTFVFWAESSLREDCVWFGPGADYTPGNYLLKSFPSPPECLTPCRKTQRELSKQWISCTNDPSG